MSRAKPNRVHGYSILRPYILYNMLTRIYRMSHGDVTNVHIFSMLTYRISSRDTLKYATATL